jgi:excisionase family DNA binding protein
MAADTPWMTAREAATYLKRGRRFVIREIHDGKLRGARIGGRGEIVTCRAWCDAYVEQLATPVLVTARRRA